MSVLTSSLKVRNGGWVPGARFCRSAGFLHNHVKRKTGRCEDENEANSILCAPFARSPLQVHRGDVEHDSFEPEDHEEPLGEGAVPDAFTITARLHTNTSH